MSQVTNANADLSFAGFAGNPPAERVQQKLKFLLPGGYIDFMLTRNGGEGFIGGAYIILWKIDDLLSINDAYQVAEFAPGLFLFGSNGGGEAFGFDTRSEAREIISIPFVPMEIAEARTVAPDFDTFLSALSAL